MSTYKRPGFVYQTKEKVSRWSGSSSKRSAKYSANLERRHKAELETLAQLDEKQKNARTMPGSGKRG